MATGTQTKKATGSKPATPTPNPMMQAMSDALEKSITTKMMAAIKDATKGKTATPTQIQQMIDDSDIDTSSLVTTDAFEAAKVDINAAFETKVSQDDFDAFVTTVSAKTGLDKTEVELIVEDMLGSGQFKAMVGQQVLDDLLTEPTDGSDPSVGYKAFEGRIGGILEDQLEDLAPEIGEMISATVTAGVASTREEMIGRYALHRVDEPGTGGLAFGREAGLAVRNWYLRPVGSLVRVPLTYAIAFGGVSLLSATLLANQAWAQHWLFRFGVPAILTIANEIIAWRVRAAFYGDREPTGPEERKAERKSRKAGRKAERAAKKAEAEAKAAVN